MSYGRVTGEDTVVSKGGESMGAGHGYRGTCFHCACVTLTWKCSRCRRRYCPRCFEGDGSKKSPFGLWCQWCAEERVGGGGSKREIGRPSVINLSYLLTNNSEDRKKALEDELDEGEEW